MSRLSFEEAVARLGEYQSRGWRLGLDRMQEFLRRLGLEDKLGHLDNSGLVTRDSGLLTRDSPQYIHVAGTNGKGSVCAFLQSLLHEQGYKVGATFSPYVYDVRERVQLGRDLISKEDFARLTETLLAVGETLEDTEFGGPTEFEMKTALGFLYWAEKKCDWVALEVGLGGRLDATNVVDPACSVITTIGLDHTAILGDTEVLIAKEKAGIIKPGRPVVLGRMPSQEVEDAIVEIAEQKGCEIWRYRREYRYDGDTVTTPNNIYRGLEPSLRGTFQMRNLAVAICAMELAGAIRNKDPIARGAKRASLPGRFEVCEYEGRTLILDGAHNRQAARALVRTLKETNTLLPVTLITGRLEGHDDGLFYKALGNSFDRALVSRIEFHRSRNPEDVIKEAGLKNATPFESSKEALEAAIRETKEGDTILVTGSFYLVGEIGNLIKS